MSNISFQMSSGGYSKLTIRFSNSSYLAKRDFAFRAVGYIISLSLISCSAYSQSTKGTVSKDTSTLCSSEIVRPGVLADVGNVLTQTPIRPLSRQVAPEASESGNIWREKYLLGNWNGTRTRLEDKGISFDVYYIADSLGDPYGARSDFGVWGRIRTSMDVDFSKLTSWKGLTFHATGLWQYGTDLSKQYLLTAINSSSLPSAHTLRLDSYFLQQYLLQHKLVIRAGQIAAYDSYGDSELSGSFINLALGYAQSNLNSAAYLSFNPAGVPAFEVKVLPTDHFYVKSMVESEERNPYTQNPNGFSFHLGGPVFSGEIGYLHDPPEPPDATYAVNKKPLIRGRESRNHPATYRFGAGYDPHNFTDLLTGVAISGNYVLYAQANQSVYRLSSEGPDKNRGLDLTYSQDYAPGNITQYSDQLWAGARWVGPAGGRWSRDSIALGYVRTGVGSHYREMILATQGKSLTAEHLVEANYLANVTPWFLVQPVLQWFVRPLGDATRETIFVIGFRTKTTF